MTEIEPQDFELEPQDQDFELEPQDGFRWYAILLMLILLPLTLYFLPTIFLLYRDRPNMETGLLIVGIINLFFGWTGMGWLIAMALSIFLSVQ